MYRAANVAKYSNFMTLSDLYHAIIIKELI